MSVDGERGLIAAPATLVQHARKIRVRLADGRTLEGRSLGVDTRTGAACIEIRAPKLRTANAAKPDAVDVGDWVVALGGPASGNALTVGIISSKDQPGKGERAATKVLRTDAFVSWVENGYLAKSELKRTIKGSKADQSRIASD